MNQKITRFHKDEENHSVADLECGHAQHVRHDPPWMDRPWTQTQRDAIAASTWNSIACVAMNWELLSQRACAHLSGRQFKRLMRTLASVAFVPKVAGCNDGLAAGT